MRGHILYLVPDLFGPPGGIARHGRLVCRALSEAGASFSIVALHDAKADGRRGATPFPPGTYQACEGRRWAFVWKALAAIPKRPALVLIEHPHFAPLGWVAARLSRCPLVVFAHGIEIWKPLPPVRAWAFRHADRVICVSSVTANRAAQANRLAPGKTRVLHNCLDPDFRPPASPHRACPSLSLLTVSRISGLEGYKGHREVIQALPALLARFPDLVYDVVGDGTGRPELEALAAEQGVAHAVRFHGIVSDEVLPDYYARTSLYVMPSQSEGFGFVFLEAMIHAKPVIAGNQDSSVEVVRDGETGFLVNPTDVCELTDRITRLLQDAGLRHQMGLRGAQVVQSAFSFQGFRQGLMVHLTEFLERSWEARYS